jgi:hypothetical protein
MIFILSFPLSLLFFFVPGGGRRVQRRRTGKHQAQQLFQGHNTISLFPATAVSRLAAHRWSMRADTRAATAMANQSW